MTKEKFNQMCADLEQRGYKRNFKKGERLKGNGWHHYWKTLERRKDKWGDERAINMLIFKIWHFEDYADRVPAEGMYNLEPVVMFSRSSDERIDLSLSHPKRSIDELEEIAVKFGKWADENIKEIEEL